MKALVCKYVLFPRLDHRGQWIDGVPPYKMTPFKKTEGVKYRCPNEEHPFFYWSKRRSVDKKTREVTSEVLPSGFEKNNLAQNINDLLSKKFGKHIREVGWPQYFSIVKRLTKGSANLDK